MGGMVGTTAELKDLGPSPGAELVVDDRVDDTSHDALATPGAPTRRPAQKAERYGWLAQECTIGYAALQRTRTNSVGFYFGAIFSP